MVLVSYYYFDDGVYAAANLNTFLRSPPIEGVHYIFYGVDIDLSPQVSNAWPNASNYVCKSVSNKLFDFQGFKLSIGEFLSYKDYEFLIVLNSTVSGPFAPNHFRTRWPDLFTNLFLDNEGSDVGLAGSTISILDSRRPEGLYFNSIYDLNWPIYPHVQSFCICIDKACAKALLENTYFTDIPDTFESRLDAIAHYEINLSTTILKMGRKLRCLVPETNVELQKGKLMLGSAFTTPHCDFGLPKGFKGRDLSPYEGVFMKTRRNQSPLDLTLTYSISNHMKNGDGKQASEAGEYYYKVAAS